MVKALTPHYDVRIFGVHDRLEDVLDKSDIVAFPGGIGDVSTYDNFFRRRSANRVADFVAGGGKYLGICMGAYWAGSRYFDILRGVDVEQYIKRPKADIKRPYGTVAKVTWKEQKEFMFFYDGGVMVGDESQFKTIARYNNGDPMAIIQGNVGIIGCHPESESYWYNDPYQYISQYWHQGKHHKLLLEFVDELTQSSSVRYSEHKDPLSDSQSHQTTSPSSMNASGLSSGLLSFAT
jgi:glutamine amidotransferase-like uncharacterized protein